MTEPMKCANCGGSRMIQSWYVEDCETCGGTGLQENDEPQMDTYEIERANLIARREDLLDEGDEEGAREISDELAHAQLMMAIREM